jgi:hypothetical protein
MKNRLAWIPIALLLLVAAAVILNMDRSATETVTAHVELASETASTLATPAAAPGLPELDRQPVASAAAPAAADLLEFVHAGSEAAAADAEITITALDDHHVTEHRSTADGRLRLQLPRGGCIVRASADLPGRSAPAVGIARVMASEAPIHQRVVLEARDGGAFTLFVMRHSSPVAGIAVALSDAKTLMRGQTDAAGKFDFAPSSLNRLFFFVGEPRAALAKRLVTPEEIVQGFAVVHMDHAALTLELTDPYGLAAAVAVSLEVPPACDLDDGRYWYAKGGDRIEVPNLPPGNYRLLLSVRDPQGKLTEGHIYASQVHHLEMGDEDQTVTCKLEPAPSLELQVEDASGRPVTHARVRIEWGVPDMTLNPDGITWSSRGAQSSFLLPSGPCRVHVDRPADGYGVLELNSLPGERLTRTVRLERRGFPLRFVLEQARVKELEFLRIYGHDGELIRIHDGRIRGGVNFISGGSRSEPPKDQILELGYYAGGEVRVEVTLVNGGRVEFMHHPVDENPFRLELP